MNQQDQPQPKKIWIAIFLSILIPGLGHLYANRVTKGIFIFMALWILFIILAVSPIATSFDGFVILGFSLFLLWIYNILDAAWIVKKTKSTEKKAYDRWYVYISIWIIVSLFTGYAYPKLRDSFARVHFAQYATSSMSPSMQAGDRFVWNSSISVARNDMTVFRYVGDENTMYVARCVATPGDNMEIKQGLVYINGKLSDNLDRIKFSYVIENGGNIDGLNTDRNAITWLNEKQFMIELTPREAESAQNAAHTDNIRRATEAIDQGSLQVFPFAENLDWNMENYGPIIIPKKGDRIEINEYNAIFYGMIILNCEDVHIDINEEGLLEQEGKTLTSYTFQQDYYFMMGDNRDNSYDSRFKGVVPSNLILGKVKYIWWSTERENIGKSL